MHPRTVRLIAAIAVPGVVLPIAQWYDAGVLVDITGQTSMTYDPRLGLYGTAAAHVLTGTGAVAIVAAVWLSRSSVLGVAYALIGGFIALVPGLAALLAFSFDDRPPLAPEPVARFISDRWWDLSRGVTGSVYMIGAVMLASGVAVVVARALASRGGRSAET